MYVLLCCTYHSKRSTLVHFVMLLITQIEVFLEKAAHFSDLELHSSLKDITVHYLYVSL